MEICGGMLAVGTLIIMLLVIFAPGHNDNLETLARWGIIIGTLFAIGVMLLIMWTLGHGR